MYAMMYLEWDSYTKPDPLNLFGVDAEVVFSSSPKKAAHFPGKADVAWDMLEEKGFEPVAWGNNGKRLPVAGYVRPVYVRFKKVKS